MDKNTPPHPQIWTSHGGLIKLKYEVDKNAPPPRPQIGTSHGGLIKLDYEVDKNTPSPILQLLMEDL